MVLQSYNCRPFEERPGGQELELFVDRLANTGEGIGALQGRSVFVSGAFPGERILAELTDTGRVRRARLVQVLEPSPERKPSVCSLSNRCGGCDWLSLSLEAQRAAKTEILLQALERQAGISRSQLRIASTPSPVPAVSYRRRAVFHLSNQKLCLYGHRSHQSVAIPRCVALVPSLQDLPARLSPLLAPLSPRVEAVHLLAEGQAVAFGLFLSGGIREGEVAQCHLAIRQLSLCGAVLVPKTGPAAVLGKPVLKTPCPLRPDVALYVRPDVFVQMHGEANVELCRSVVDHLAPSPKQTVLELFAGNGNFTFSIAGAAAHVTAAESSVTAIDLARRSARESRVENVRFIQGQAAVVCRGLASEGVRFDQLVVDPPRTGFRGISSHARALGVQRVVYVSCDASSLARDAAELRKAGFMPISLSLLDMFPFTHHLEAVLLFRKDYPPTG